MKSILNYLKNLYSGPFQAALVFSFTLVAVLTIGIGTWVITRTITDYLAGAMDERIEQDLITAEIIYHYQQEELAQAANQIALSKTVMESFLPAAAGAQNAARDLEHKIEIALLDGILKGNRVAVILDDQGVLIAGVTQSTEGKLSYLPSGSSWADKGVFEYVRETGSIISSTEVIPEVILDAVGLAEQARIEILDTPKASAELFDPREGRAGLGIVGAAPIRVRDQIVGVVIIFHLLNNDFTLVDAIKESAKIDTATIFFGDLRVSTNVMTEAGERAVGTRLSEGVSQVVLQEGKEYVGTAFVVNEDYITRYEPVEDHEEKVIGILYVGARQAPFLDFLNVFRRRISLVAAITVVMTFLLATPVSRKITQPLQDLRVLSQTSQQVALGNIQARAPETAGGEVGVLAKSFNEMLDRLQDTQNQLVQSEKMASLGQLSAGVAHELNNPLGTVLLFSEALLREQKNDQRAAEDLGTIIRETERCRKIVASLLDFARQNQLDTAEINLNLLIQKLIDLEKMQRRFAGIQIDPQFDPALPNIQGDMVQLQALISNLLTNAADAMPGGGKLVLRTYSVSKDLVGLEIEDNGEGITPENQSRLFTPFFTTKPPGKGTGLGLSIVYGIIKMHRGQISVRSQPGSGTTFIIQLPIRQPERTPPERENGNHPENDIRIG
jgi:two-component system NtrC family sensor kinase